MQLLLGFWNLENLFAPEGFPNREPWIAKAVKNDLKGWTEGLFARKVAQLASIITQMKGGAGPDLLGVCEVENRFALQSVADRLNALLPERRYDLVHVDSTRDRRGIDTAFLFDANVLAVNAGEIFSHWVMRRTGTRDITQATFVTRAGHELIALANHWPSRSGGDGPERSAGFRATAAETLSYWHDRIREVKGVDAAVIAVGDLNDQPFDASLTIHAVALRDLGDVVRARSAKFYNLAWRYLSRSAIDHEGNERSLDGTLYFQNDAFLFDHILVSPALLKTGGPLRLVEDSAKVEAFPEMVSHRVGEGAIRFGLPKGDAGRNVNVNGFSDHFPVSVAVEVT